MGPFAAISLEEDAVEQLLTDVAVSWLFESVKTKFVGRGSISKLESIGIIDEDKIRRSRFC